jgi:hypothetical protein
MLLVLILRPAGITGGREIPWPRIQPRRGSGPALEAESVSAAEP